MRFFTLAFLLLSASYLTAQTNHDVEVSSNQFSPAILMIQLGDTVTWTNVQGTHNVNANLSAFPDNPEGFGNGNAAPPGWIFQYVFNTPGTYDYRCDPHFEFGMIGQIVVDPSSNVAEPAWAAEVRLFPNPSKGVMTVNLPLDIDNYRLLDLQGRVVSESGLQRRDQLILNLSNLPSGLYQLQMFAGSSVVTRPVMKQ